MSRFLFTGRPGFVDGMFFLSQSLRCAFVSVLTFPHVRRRQLKILPNNPGLHSRERVTSEWDWVKLPSIYSCCSAKGNWQRIQRKKIQRVALSSSNTPYLKFGPWKYRILLRCVDSCSTFILCFGSKVCTVDQIFNCMCVSGRIFFQQQNPAVLFSSFWCLALNECRVDREVRVSFCFHILRLVLKSPWSVDHSLGRNWFADWKNVVPPVGRVSRLVDNAKHCDIYSLVIFGETENVRVRCWIATNAYLWRESDWTDGGHVRELIRSYSEVTGRQVLFVCGEVIFASFLREFVPLSTAKNLRPPALFTSTSSEWHRPKNIGFVNIVSTCILASNKFGEKNCLSRSRQPAGVLVFVHGKFSRGLAPTTSRAWLLLSVLVQRCRVQSEIKPNVILQILISPQPKQRDREFYSGNLSPRHFQQRPPPPARTATKISVEVFRDR